MKTSIQISDELKESMSGEYYSTELDAKCRISLQDKRLVFETSDSTEVPLTHAYNLEFTGNRFWIEVVEFIQVDGEIKGLEVSELRSRQQYFAKM